MTADDLFQGKICMKIAIHSHINNLESIYTSFEIERENGHAR